MSTPRIARLEDRGVVRVAGPDATSFLQGLVTNDIEKLATRPAIHAALLTPQGKILFDFLVVRDGDGYLLELQRDKVAELVKRLGFYRLRAKLEIVDASAVYEVAAYWGAAPDALGEPPSGSIVLADPRLAALGWRGLARVPEALAGAGPRVMDPPRPAAPYHEHRIGLGVPEGGRDYAYGDAFPHEANLDQLNGVDFEKGCYVGQEIVARMEHRGTARKRLVPVKGMGPLPQPGTEVTAGEVSLGTLGSVAGGRALAMLRLDRAAEALQKGEAVSAGGVALQLMKPSWWTAALWPEAGGG
jgi:hypothetical protein